MLVPLFLPNPSEASERLRKSQYRIKSLTTVETYQNHSNADCQNNTGSNTGRVEIVVELPVK